MPASSQGDAVVPSMGLPSPKLRRPSSTWHLDNFGAGASGHARGNSGVDVAAFRGAVVQADSVLRPPAADGDAGDAADGVVLQGYLHKCNKNGRFWRRRWCVLLGHSLRYFTSKDDAAGDPQGTIDMEMATLLPPPASGSMPTKYAFRLQGVSRTYTFCADSAAELKRWASAVLVVTDALHAEVKSE